MITNLTEANIIAYFRNANGNREDFRVGPCSEAPSLSIEPAQRSKLFDMRHQETYLDLDIDFDIKEIEQITKYVRSELIANDDKIAVVDILSYLALRDSHLADYIVPLNYSDGTGLNLQHYTSVSYTHLTLPTNREV